MHSLKNGIMGKEGKLQRKQGYKKDQDESTAHMKWRELNVFLVFGYGRVHLVLRLRSSKAEPAKAESQFKLVRSDRKEQQEAQDTLKKGSQLGGRGTDIGESQEPTLASWARRRKERKWQWRSQ